MGLWLRDAGSGLQESPEARVIADIARDRKTKTSQVHANLGWLGMVWIKLFGILVEVWGEGAASPSTR